MKICYVDYLQNVIDSEEIDGEVDFYLEKYFKDKKFNRYQISVWYPDGVLDIPFLENCFKLKVARKIIDLLDLHPNDYQLVDCSPDYVSIHIFMKKKIVRRRKIKMIQKS